MQLPGFTVEHLKQLPLRAIVAFAARCARRVEPLAQLPEAHPERERRREAVAAALRFTEAVAGGSTVPPEDAAIAAIDATDHVAGAPVGTAEAAAAVTEAAHAAACARRLIASEAVERAAGPGTRTAAARDLRALADVTADIAALDAFTAAVEANDAVGYDNEGFVAAALYDYDRLIRLKLGRYPELGDPVDPSPTGPLGPL